MTWRAGILLALVLVQLHPSAALAARPEWVKPVGSYRLVKWSRSSTGDPRAVPLESIIIRDRQGCQLARITNNYVDVKLIEDLTNDGSPEAVIHAAQRGAHGPVFYYLYSLGSKPRCLLAYAKGNIDGGSDLPDFALKDLDGDGRKEIVTWYDGFAYWTGGGYWWLSSFGGAARVPVVLGYRRGRYVEVTAHHRQWLHAKLVQAKRRLLAELARAEGQRLVGDASQSIIEYYAIALIFHPPAEARRLLLKALPAQDRPGFLAIHRRIEAVVAARGGRYSYPAVYLAGQVRVARHEVAGLVGSIGSSR